MFGYLESTQRDCYEMANMKSFVYSFKDADGQPTNYAIQQDCGEFLTFLLDRIET